MQKLPPFRAAQEEDEKQNFDFSISANVRDLFLVQATQIRT